jgi:hypothetical protein
MSWQAAAAALAARAWRSSGRKVVLEKEHTYVESDFHIRTD